MSVFLACNGYGQFDFDLAGGTRHLSLGRASVSGSGSEAIFNNPAGLAHSQGIMLSVNALRRYNIAGLDYFSGGLAYGHNLNAFSFKISQKGLDDYRESSFGFSYARHISEQISLGSTFNYNHLSQIEFDDSGYFSFDVGLLSKISDKLVLGLQIINPTNRKIDDFNVKFSAIRLGTKLLISKELDLYTEIQKNSGLNPELKVGIDYKIIQNFNVLIGVIPTNSEFTFGFGYIFNNKIDINGAFLYDQRIDISPAFGLSYNSNRK